MSTYLDAVDALVDELAAADIRASVDLRDINPPAVWIHVVRMAPSVLCGDELTVDLYCVVADTGTKNTLAALEALVSKTLDVVRTVDYPVELSVSLGLPVGPPLPAAKITTTLSLDD